MTELNIDLDHVRRGGGEVSGCADQLHQAVGRLRSEVLGAGSPWGGDEFGTIFAAAYTAVTDQALDRYAALAGRLADVGAGLTKVADNLQTSDESAAARHDAITSGL